MCRIDFCDDMPSVSSETVRTARKAHRCNECGRDIHPGEQYRSLFQVYDGSPGTFKTCQHCRVAQTWLIENCGGYMIEDVYSEMKEHAEEYPDMRVPLYRIAVGMKRHWRRFDSAGLMALPAMPPTIEEHAREGTR